MTFIKYTNDGKAVIQPAALTLSGLEQEETLEMHTLENAIVLLKQEMEPVEKAAAILPGRWSVYGKQLSRHKPAAHRTPKPRRPAWFFDFRRDAPI